MRIINRPDEIINSLLGKQTIDKKISYRLSSFCFLKKIKDETIIFNNLTKEMISLSENEAEFLKELPILSSELLKTFIEGWFLVPINFDDCKVADQVLQFYQIFKQKDGITNYVILPTSDCNARCYYCFEHGARKIHMSKQTAIDVANFIIKHHNSYPVEIKWFGGEPLYNIEAIDTICKILYKNNISFKSRMTTNGFLFDDDNILKAKNKWNLHRVQITLDGTEKNYNRIKNYIHENCNPFNIVTDNIEKLLHAKIKVSLRLNITESNIQDMYDLIDFIENRYSHNEYLKIYAANLYDLKNIRTESEKIKLTNMWKEFEEHLYNKGLKNHSMKRWLKINRGCMAQNDSSVVILPNGKLGKCEHYVDGEKSIGDIYNSSFDYNTINYWKEFKKLEECKYCVVYPNCFGVSNCPSRNSICSLDYKNELYHLLEKSIVSEYFRNI